MQTSLIMTQSITWIYWKTTTRVKYSKECRLSKVYHVKRSKLIAWIDMLRSETLKYTRYSVKTSVLKKTWNYSWPHNLYHVKLKTILTRNLLLTTHTPGVKYGSLKFIKAKLQKLLLGVHNSRPCWKGKAVSVFGPLESKSFQPGTTYLHRST